MPTFESDLERVLAHQRNILDAQLVGFEALHASETSREAGLAATFRARAGPSKALTRVGAAMPTLPLDDHDLPLAVDVDCERKRIGVFQGRAYRTLMTGSCRND